MLTGDERQRLRDIELGLRRDDPMFAATMQSWRLQPQHRRRTPRSFILIVVALVLAVGTVVLGLLL